jgi:excisionase family DNA binding protein
MEDINDLPIFNSVANAAKRLSIGRTMFFRLLKEGRINACRIGSRTLISESELQRFAAEIQNGEQKQAKP